MNKKDLLQNIGLIVLPNLIRLICLTLRVKVIKPDNFEVKSNFVFMFWHGTMIVPWYYNRNNNFVAVVSQSKDGEILSKTLKKWNYELIRGSSSVDSKIVFQNMIEALQRGKNLAITPDGPRGEIYKLKIGGIIAAMRTGKEIVLCGAAYSKKIKFNSWDKFELPLPFSKAVLILSSPIKILPDLSREDYEKIRQNLETELNKLQAEALAYV